MNDVSIRLFLGCTTIVIALYWTITNTYSLSKTLLNITSLRGLTVKVVEAILILQILDIIHVFLPSTGVDSYIILSGIFIHSIGLTIALWARYTMRNNWGIPAQHDVEKQKELVTHGPFSFSRNPIYVGLIIFFLGFELSLRSYLVFLTPILMYLVYKAVLIEEKLLGKHFGKKYMEYKKKTPRFLPFLRF